jgi:hypothetical protein
MQAQESLQQDIVPLDGSQSSLQQASIRQPTLAVHSQVAFLNLFIPTAFPHPIPNASVLVVVA